VILDIITCLNKDLVPKGLSNLNFIMPFYIIVIFSILIFFRFNNLLKAIKSKKALKSEIFTTLLSIIIAVFLYLYINKRN
jgi:capsular polysaccharide biosynthesis protein